MNEDTIIAITAIVLMGGALYIGSRFRDTKGMAIFKKIMFPFTLLKSSLDPNWWANKIGNNANKKAHSSKLAQWSRSLIGWKWWAYQIGAGLLFVIVAEFLLNLIGLSMLPWKW